MKVTFNKGFKVPNRGPKVTPYLEYWIKSIKYNGNTVDITFDDVPQSKILGLSTRYLHSIDRSLEPNPEIKNQLDLSDETTIKSEVIENPVVEAFVSSIPEGTDLTNVEEENSKAVDQLLEKESPANGETEKNAEETIQTSEETKEVKTRRKQSRQSPE